MIIFNEIYKALQSQLNGVASIQKVDWYNEQYQNTEDERATRYPAVYIEFLDPVNWVQNGRRWQHATIGIKLHLVVFDLLDSPLRALEFGQLVFEQLNNAVLTDANSGQLTTELVRESTTFPKRYNQLKIIELTWQCEAFDSSGMQKVESTQVSNFIINA